MKKNIKKIIGILLVIGIFTVLFFYPKKNNEGKGITPVIFNLGSDYNTLDPHLFTEMIAVQIDSGIYEGLLILDKKGNYTGGVAESFTEVDNKITFKLRENAKWSDGSKITANDFVFAFKRVLNPETAAQFSEMLFPIKNAEKYYEGKVEEKDLGIKALDNKTLEIELENPVPYFKYILTLPIAVPLKEEFYKSKGDRYAVKLEGFLFNGAYKITGLKEDEILLEKNENYWNSKNIKIPKIKYIVSRDFRVVDNLIKNGEIDMSRVEHYNLPEYKKEGTLDTFINGRLWYLDFNFNNQFLENKKLRQAISFAINREKYVKEIKKDGSIIAKSVISNIITGYNGKYRDNYPDDKYFKDNDIENAKRLYKEALKELGISKLKLELLTGNSDPEILEIQFLQEELRTKLGLETEVVTVSFKERLTRTRAGNYDIVLNTWSPKYDDSLSYLERWKQKNEKNQDIWSKNKYNSLINEILVLGNGIERDRKINQAERILIDEVVIVPLYFSVENHYRNSQIKGIIRRPITGIASFDHAYRK
ncbi:peptide ABC transporter substrate-binding protein [Leptotrichia sp. OH3620_COT-345]|uniref:peptide ABC transporter substrate-binding protein n=1 Tax=Leptotrichia sp. OH3620_COT-345 TaxID=2491048 RepID=UPI000F64AE90|nr:peptide ABC transporter substrate-binding protein [Leptotrichia sp. OH3620_COT-345]RRD39702.1 peptide ABC transporter substrate-binding protein [Leptotrichia sp. OH3620_COT-345]